MIMQLNPEQIALIEATTEAAVSKSEARMLIMIRKELHEHEVNCPKFELGVGKLVVACLGSGGLVALIERLVR